MPRIKPVPLAPWEPLEAFVVNVHGAGSRQLLHDAYRNSQLLLLHRDLDHEHQPPIAIASHTDPDQFTGYLNREAAWVVAPALEEALHLVATVTGPLEPNRGGQMPVIITLARDAYSALR